MDVGVDNAKYVIEYMKSKGLTTVKTDLGDIFPRKACYFTDSGRVLMRKIEHVKNRPIFERENEYAVKINRWVRQPEEDVTLF